MRQTLFLTAFCVVCLIPAASLAEGGQGRLAALDSAFEGWKEAAASGDSLLLREAEEEVRAALRELDMNESEALAAAALLESERHREAGLAERMAAFAVELAPSFPPAHFQLAKLRLKASPLALGGWLGPYLDGFASYRLSARHGRPLAHNLSLALLVSLLVAGLAALAAGLYRHFRRLAHDLHHLLPWGPPAPLAGAAVCGAVALLAALFPAPLLWSGVFAIGLTLYFKKQERWAIALFLLGVGQLPVFLSWVEERTAWSDTPAALLDAVDTRGSILRIGELRALAQSEGAPPEALFALARYEKRAGRPEEAARLYDQVLRLRPDWPAALVNRGNLDFMEGELGRAQERYERAAALDPGLAEAWFGLSRVHYRRVDIARGQEARDRALEIRPALAERYNAGEEEASRTLRYLADVALRDEDLAPLASPSGALKASLLARLWGPIPGEAAPIAGGVLALLVLLLPLGGMKASRGCPQCGAPVCPRCERSAEEGETCKACQQLASRQRGLDPAVRNRKEVEIARYARRKHLLTRAASFIALGPFLRGRTLWGLLLLTAVGTALLGGLMGGATPPPFGDWPLGLRAAFLPPVLVAIGLSVWASSGEEA